MNNPEKRPPLLAQEANEEPGAFQEPFLVLDDEMVEGVIGAGICASCIGKVKQPSPPSSPDVTNVSIDAWIAQQLANHEAQASRPNKKAQASRSNNETISISSIGPILNES